MFKNIGEKIKLPFLFGIGGIGDFLLLMSDGTYDTHNELGLIFWANNPTTIKELVKLFPKIQKSIVLPNYLESTIDNSHLYFSQIINDEKFLSKAHIPEHLQYVSEWNNCNVFDKYKIQKRPDWVNDWTVNGLCDGETYSVFAPTGGSSDTGWKHKFIKRELLLKLIDEDKHPIKYIISTDKEMDGFYGNRFVRDELLTRNVRLIYNESLDKLFGIICKASVVYSVDTWVKTLSLFTETPTILIESFYENSPFERIGLNKDPGDFIFIENWTFQKRISQ